MVAAPLDAAEIAFTELGPLGEVIRSLPALLVTQGERFPARELPASFGAL